MANFPVLATPHDSTLSMSITDVLTNGEWTVMATVMGVGATHCLAMREPDWNPETNSHSTACIYYVILENGSSNGIRQYMTATRDFPVYRVASGDIFPLAHLVTEAAHDEYLVEIGEAV